MAGKATEQEIAVSFDSDPDQTLLKKVASPGRTVNSITAKERPPELTSSGYVQGAQPQHLRNEQIVKQESDISFNVEIYEHCEDDVYTAENYETYHSKEYTTDWWGHDQLFDELDAALDGLPRETYISKILQTAESCEDSISRYRSELAQRAKRCKNGPTGALITRRSTAKGSIAEKYASDCYLLHQFINGNISDVNELFKSQQPAVQSARLNSTCIGDDSNASLLSAEMNLMKETVSQLVADVSLLKSTVNQTHDSLTSITNAMANDISGIKKELDDCKTGLHKSINAEMYPHVADSNLLSVKLAHIGRMVSRLDKSRMHIEQNVKELEVCARDNANGVKNLNDVAFIGNKSVKGQIKELKEQLTTVAADVSIKDSVVKTNDECLENMSKKIKLIEKKIEEPKCSKLEMAFDKFSKDITAKIDKLCDVAHESLKTRVHDNLLRNKQTGLFSRPSYAEITKTIPNEVLLESHQNTSNASYGICSDTSDNPEERLNVVDSTCSKKMSIRNNLQCMGDDASRDSEKRFSNPIPVLGTSAQKQGRFKGVVRKKLKNYFLTGIDPDSDEEGLRDFLEENDVTFSEVRLFRPRRGNSLAAKISVWEEHAPVVESEYFWPGGIVCKRWLTRPEIRNMNKQRREYENEEYEHRD